MPEFSQFDQHWMQEALRLAALGQGYVEPNPMVGCVLVKDGNAIGAGYHKKYGGPHAEVEALSDAVGKCVEGATAYVTLEPCCHFGKTPPCTDSLIAAKVARVVAASRDPHAVVDGGGLAKLRAAGIQVEVGLLESESRELNAPYFKRIETAKPWVIAKWAMSLDGKIATRTGHSQWISGEASRRWVHELRGRVDAVVVGIGTALADDPLLTARPAGLRQALRVVVDSNVRLPIQSQLVKTARVEPLLICAGPSAKPTSVMELEALGCRVWVCPIEDRQQRLDEMLRILAQEYSATNILVEGGAELLGGLFELHQIDQCEVFVAPKLIGGKESPSPIAGLGVAKVSDGPQVKLVHCQKRDQDLHLSYRLRWAK
jgi:diaminohydroxyphosphoribosylaminopyrimidine deaminase / 5-amino-6-(5-phosphoribosylamino)uracil reductase